MRSWPVRPAAPAVVFPIRSLPDLRDAEKIHTAAPVTVVVQGFPLRSARDFHKTLRLHQRGTRKRWAITPPRTLDVLREALQLHRLVDDELCFLIHHMREEAGEGPLIDDLRFPALIHAAGEVTLESRRILRQPGDAPLAAVAAKAASVALEALDVCRELDALAGDLAFNREHPAVLEDWRKELATRLDMLAAGVADLLNTVVNL